MKILLVSGSIRDNSYTCALADQVSLNLKDNGIETEHWNLRKSPLPIADPLYHHSQHDYPDETVQKFISKVESCNVIVFLTPVYHNSYSGVLKNAIDHLSMSIMKGKLTALMGHGGNRTSQAVDHLRIVMRSLNVYTLYTQICTSREDFGDDFSIVSPNIKKRIERFITELKQFPI